MDGRVGQDDLHERLDVETGLEALGRQTDFRGPVEPLDVSDHDHATDHVALVYESRDEQLQAAIPFVRQGLERGERCLYVADENTRSEVLAAMRAQGIDVDTALDSGALSVHTPAETYQRTGEFDEDDMFAFWEESLEQATEGDGYTGIRVAAEMTWALEAEIPLDRLTEYEAKLNDIYEDEDYAVLCQYNRTRFPSTVIHDVVRTHPHLINDGAAYHNVYYTPPEEYFEPGHSDHEVDRMLGTLRERTEVKRELEERTEYVEQIFENSHDAIFIVDPAADELVDANPAAAEMLGYPREELLSLRPSDIHPDELDEFREFVDDVYETGSGWTDELTCRTRDHGRIVAEISAARMDWDGRPVMLAVVRDVTERKRRERAQKRLYEIAADTDRTFDEKLQDVFTLGCDFFDIEYGGIAKVDADADLFEVEAISGEHDYLVPSERYPLSETYCREVTNGSGTTGITDPVDAGYEGKLCYDRFGVRTYLGTFLELDSGPDRTFFFLSNERREEPFSEADRTFHHLMGQWIQYELERQRRERELEETVRQLEQSNDRLKQFAYAASHDLQEPLRMVSSYLQLLENRHRADLDEEAREYIDFAVDGADRMRAMVDDLLAYSRVEQSDGEFRPVECDDLIDDVRADLEVKIEESDAELTVESLPTVVADGEQLTQLFTNLVSNAIKYSGDDPPRIEIGAEEHDDRWEFAVSDDGIGIDPDDIDRIFEVFKRLHHADEYPGTGIGLSLCQEIVENHGGDIWVESEPGAGTTFFFTIPRQTTER